MKPYAVKKMNLKKLHKDKKWLLSAIRSKKDSGIINVKIRSINGKELNYSIITMKKKEK